VGFVDVSDVYRVDPVRDCALVFGTADTTHPGVAKEIARSTYRVGGGVTVTNAALLANSLNPEDTRREFQRRGWSTVVAFHTRNPVHRAHEHLQRTGLEVCDGLFINPALGWKKPGDFSDKAIMRAYEVMIEHYYPRSRVHLAGLPSAMRYAGPREAVFHALIRRNLGCTHIIIGRDHAGVGEFYGRYEAQQLARGLDDKYGLGIKLLLLSEPYYCRRCGQTVSERNCCHDGSALVEISGTLIREMVRHGQRPGVEYLRPEVADVLLAMGEETFLK